MWKADITKILQERKNIFKMTFKQSQFIVIPNLEVLCSYYVFKLMFVIKEKAEIPPHTTRGNSCTTHHTCTTV